MRNIDKAGGLDGYILNTPDKYLQSDIAINLKIQMLERLLREQNLIKDGESKNNTPIDDNDTIQKSSSAIHDKTTTPSERRVL